jgi:multicomponent Na+:H+ antiporter subunit G
MLAGCVVALLAAVGIARLPDAFMRMHAATKAGVIATGLCVAGAAIASGETSA